MFGRLPLVLMFVLSGSACRSGAIISPENAPPGDYGRPSLVRGVARAGTYIGATAGIAATVVLWPLTKGTSLLVEEPFGYSEKEWTLLPLTGFTAAGHYLLGLPVEGLYYVFYGAWVDDPPPVGFDHTPRAPPR